MSGKRGFTLIEMTITLAIMAVLASVAVPYAETMIIRSKETELRASLRTIRQAIDSFHDDWKRGIIPKNSNDASSDGYPKTLYVLTEGAETGAAVEKRIKYLRRIPRDPFAPGDIKTPEQWGLRSYGDSPDSSAWGGDDVYDIYSLSDKRAKDGSYYADW